MQESDAIVDTSSHCHPVPLNLRQAQHALQNNEEAVRDAEQRLKQALAQQVHLCQVQRTLEHRQLLELVEQGVRQPWYQGCPVLAMLIHRCLLHWQALQHPDHAGQAMLEALARAISRHTDDTQLSSPHPHDLHHLSHYAYWLCVTSVTLALLHAAVPGSSHAPSAAGKGAVGFIVGLEDEPVKDSAAKQAMGQFKNKMASLGNMLKRSHLGGPSPEPSPAAVEEGGSGQNGGAKRGNSVDEKADSTRTSSMSSSQAGGVNSRRESSGAVGIDGGEAKRAKAPLVFLSQLDQLQLGCYSCILDTSKKNLTQVLPDCIQAPSPASPSRPSSPANTPRHSQKQRQEAQQQQQQQQQGLDQVQGQQSQAHQQLLPSSDLPPQPQPEHQPQQLEGLHPQQMEQQQQQQQQGQQQQQLQLSEQKNRLEDARTGKEDHMDGHRPGEAQGRHPQQASFPYGSSKQQQQQQQQQPQQQHQEIEQEQQSQGQEQQQQQQQQPESDSVSSHKSRAPGPWVALVDVLQGGMQELRGQHVPRILIKCIFKQILAFINAQLFNQLLLRPECCSASNAQYLLAGLKFLDAWILAGVPGSMLPDTSMLKPLYPELRHTRQAVAFLVCPNKGALSLEDIASNLCPALNSQQIYRLCTTFHEDNGCSMDMVSGEVLEGLKSASLGGVHNNGGLIVTFLIDDDHHLIIAPHGNTVDEVLQVINRKEALYGPLPIPSELDTESCPRSVFAWLEAPVQMPASVEKLNRRG